MLKFLYTETDLHLELLDSDPEYWIEQRLQFASSIGETMFVSAEKASLLLPESICETTAINFYLYHQGVTTVSAERCDRDSIELGFTGLWLSPYDPDIAEGTFVTQLPDRVESYLWQLWFDANYQSVASDGVIG